jgi:hypothetical protein
MASVLWRPLFAQKMQGNQKFQPYMKKQREHGILPMDVYVVE